MKVSIVLAVEFEGSMVDREQLLSELRAGMQAEDVKVVDIT